MRITPKAELEHRLQQFQLLLQRQDIDAALLVQNADLFYFTGSIQQGVLYVPSTGSPLYLVRKDAGRARMESGLEHVLPLNSPKDLPGILSDFGQPLPARIGMELDVLPVNLYQRFQKIFTASEIVDATPLVREVRAVKSDYEIEILKDAALIVDKVCKRAREVIREGMTDLELAAELELVARRNAHQGWVRLRGFNNELFYAHVFSGADSAVPTYSDTPLGGVGLNPSFAQGASYKTIRAGEPITVDFSGVFDGYTVDQTRMFAIGELPEQLVRAYNDMVAIQQHAKLIARPGVAWGEVYDQCLQMAVDLGYQDHFMGAKGAQVSFIGHGVGVELDEYPFIARGFNSQLLQKKMVFAFEPKAVFPGLGAVGVENTFWVEDDGLKHLTFSDQKLVIL